MPAAVAVAAAVAVDAVVAVLAEKGRPLVAAVAEGGCGCQEDSTRPA
jgi:hypothetical protein